MKLAEVANMKQLKIIKSERTIRFSNFYYPLTPELPQDVVDIPTLNQDKGIIFHNTKITLAEVYQMDELELRTQMELQRLEEMLEKELGESLEYYLHV